MSENIYVVDDMMGTGKTSAAINYINKSSEEEKFIFITPFLTEIEERVIPLCADKHFVTPQADKSRTKMDSLTELVEAGMNIASTHALFGRLTPSILRRIHEQKYTLIMDEVYETMQIEPLSIADSTNLMRCYMNVNSETGQLIWNDAYPEYSGVFSHYKYLCQIGSLYLHGGNKIMRVIQPRLFTSFNKVYILTYMFDAQMLRYSFDLTGVKYKYCGVRIKDGEYEFSEERSENSQIDYRSLIHILERKSLNKIGDGRYALSSTWYDMASRANLEAVGRNMLNFFINIARTKSAENMWTSFKSKKYFLRGKGYTKGFIPVNSRAVNKFRGKTAIAYPVNIFLNPEVKVFCNQYGIRVDEDQYALSEMLQCIWRSAIRDGKEIQLYIPSERMRGLLKQWIEDNSPAADKEVS